MPVDEAWSEIAPKFIRVPLLAYKYRKAIRAWTYRGLVAVGWGRTDVVVVGRPGAGKSVLMERFAGRSGDLDWRPPNISTAVESAVIALGDDPLIVRTIPGQDSRERANGLHEALSRHTKLQGVIYVADWGFNATRDQTVASSQRSRGIDTIDKLRDYNLKAELADFKGIAQRIRDAYARTGARFWLLVVVNKADLFMDRLNEAQSFYHPVVPSEFADAISEIRNDLGAGKFNCEIVPVSSWHENFQWGNDKIDSRIDEGEARAFFANMRERIRNLSRWWER